MKPEKKELETRIIHAAMSWWRLLPEDWVSLEDQLKDPNLGTTSIVEEVLAEAVADYMRQGYGFENVVNPHVPKAD